MTLIRTSLLNGIAVIVRMLTMLGLNKLLAVYVGPAGYAAVGQFQNAMQIITTFASGAINTGVVKYTAEYSADAAAQRRLWGTAGTIALSGSIISAVVIALLSRSLAEWFLKDPGYGGVFLWFAATLALFVFNALLLAILNGKKEVGLYVVANIVGSILALAITAVLVIAWGLYGALIALAVFQSGAFIVTLSLCLRTSWFKIKYLIGPIDIAEAKSLGKYTLMALTTAACVPLSHILVRNHLGQQLGWTAAGHWEAMWRLSAAYLMLVTTTLSVYYLPRLSELREAREIMAEIFQGYLVVLPVAAISGLCLYIGRDFVISQLFTAAFFPMRDLFAWQMLGDTLKIGSWVLAYVMLGKAMLVSYVVLEVVFSFGFYALTVAFLPWLGLIGVSAAHAINYFLYWLAVAVVVRLRLPDVCER